MEYKIVKIKTCNVRGATSPGMEILRVSQLNSAFCEVSNINKMTAESKHGGEDVLCECAYEVRI